MPFGKKKEDYENLSADDLYAAAGRTMVEADYKKATKMLMLLVKKYPDHEKGRALFASLLQSGDMYDLALVHYDYLLKNHPNNAEYIGSRGLSLIMLDRPAEGKAALEKALEIDPSLERFQKVLDTMK